MIRSFPVGKTMSLDIGLIHFVGIGGIGMSGIAEVLHNLGYRVQGSDVSDSPNVERLRGLGIDVKIGHQESNVDEAAVVVISSAIKPENPEVKQARALRLPVVRRAEMLAELMRLKMTVSVAGTHGKTTTTSMVTAMFEAAGRNPTVINGGIINAYGTNAVLGKGDWMIVEADESDGTFIRIPSTIAVVTNIDPEHLDHYGSFDNLRAAFKQFLDHIPFYGFGVLCVDHPEVQALVGQITDRRVITYGFSPQANVRAVNVTHNALGQTFDVEVYDHQTDKVKVISQVHLPMHGQHNACNALAAIAVANELGMDEEAIVRGFKDFQGVKRRFTRTGTVNDITIIDDYGHHPVEITATLGSAREAVKGVDGRVIAVVQPHRYSRLQSLFKEFCTCFNDADTVVVTPVYEAGESPIEGFDRDSLIEGLKRHGHQHVLPLESEAELAEVISKIAKPNDMVVCLGAGSISKWANALPAELQVMLDKATPQAVGS
ncbi:MAG: UDP-N-acetylmuramate--L-alanine ligase [Rickettsiales bacterium]|nr:UDP-N-acetylmuramate--L-alanine ligase [Rickettsiales bacterium]